MSTTTPQPPLTGEQLQATFDRATAFTVGIEEELMLIDPETLEPAPRAPQVMSWLAGDPRFKFELPAAQIEIATEPHATAVEAATALMAARRQLAAAVDGRVRPIGAGVSPLGPGHAELVELPRYERTIRDYHPVIAWQLVSALQIHVAVPGSSRALAVYNHARAYLPWLAALAANGVFYQGIDTGLASVRPKICDLLPRQGMAPPIDSWHQYADALNWGQRSGSAPEPGTWWWELRPHPAFGTLEFRVPDTQATVADAAVLAAVIQALVVWLARRHDAGERLAVAPTWRLEENRWSACRHGVEGEMLDAETGERRGTRACLEWLLEQLAEIVAELRAATQLDRAAAMIDANGAIEQRAAAQAGGAHSVALSLAERFLEPWPG